jgi:hypothetical protein
LHLLDGELLDKTVVAAGLLERQPVGGGIVPRSTAHPRRETARPAVRQDRQLLGQLVVVRRHLFASVGIGPHTME